MTFQKATKKSARLRMALIGVAGAGKTYTALSIASYLGKKVAVLDTERGSASKYSDIFEFDVLEPETFSPKTYIDAIEM
ncbi:AAA family ATPase, partial [bacterium]